MTLTLICRTSTAFFAPSQFFIADNESVIVQLNDCGAVRHKPYLAVNGVVYAFIDGKLTIPSEALTDINACELQDRDGDGKVVKRWKTDNLIRPPFDRKQGDGETYQTEQALITSLKVLTEQVEKLTVAVLDQKDEIDALTKKVNGEYSLINFEEEGE